MPLKRLVLAAVVGLACASCTTQHLAFVQDDRLEIESPRDRETVEVPFTLSWDVEDFAVADALVSPSEGTDGSGGAFAVFLDRSPIAPGEDVKSLAGDDQSCQQLQGCPDEQWLAQRGVFVTTATQVEITVLSDTRSSDRETREPHEATIVLLDGEGRRRSEAQFRREFFFEERS